MRLRSAHHCKTTELRVIEVLICLRARSTEFVFRFREYIPNYSIEQAAPMVGSRLRLYYGVSVHYLSKKVSDERTTIRELEHKYLHCVSSRERKTGVYAAPPRRK